MLRLGYVVAVFFTTTPAYLALLWVIDRFDLPWRRRLTIGYCRTLCALLRVRIHVVGRPVQDRAVLLLFNHVSWLDIPVIAALGPHIFVAKHEIASWPVVGLAAKLQRAIFVDRRRRQQAGEAASQIADRLRNDGQVVLFAEGTSSDGNRVLPFRSALVGAAAQIEQADAILQPASIGYTRIHGMPMGRQHRPLVAWYGDLEFTPHFKGLVRCGPIDVTVTFGDPICFDGSTDRKTAAKTLEATVRRLTVAALRGECASSRPDVSRPIPGRRPSATIPASAA
jgi:1-acyl-sn-glycerol-3-phosphate acyltransferase